MERIDEPQSSDVLQNLLETISELFHIRISILDRDAVSPEAPSSPKRDMYCHRICSRLNLLDNCRNQKSEFIENVMQTDKPVRYNCHGGLTQLYYPFTYDSRLYNVIHISELRTLTAPPATIKYLWDVNTNTPEELHKEFLRIPYFRDYDVVNLMKLTTSIKDLYFTSKPLYASTPQTVQDIVTYMQYHYNRHLSLSDAAEMIHKSISRTSHLFMEVFNKSFKEIQSEILVEKAREIVKAQPQLQVQELASLLGFKDAFYFSKFYKRQTGQTISQFRKSVK